MTGRPRFGGAIATVEGFLLIGQPLVFAGGVILARFTAVPTPLESLVRPTFVVVSLAALALILLRFLTRSWAMGAMLSSALVLFSLRELMPAVVVASAAAAWPLLVVLRRVIHRRPPPRSFLLNMARATGIFGAVYLVVMGLGAARAAVAGAPEMHLPQYESSGTGGPSIYFLLLDGYPRADTLAETFGIDNRPFLGDLEGMGFSVSDEARTNYNKTWLTLASALNGAYIEDLLGDQEVPMDAPDELRWLEALIAEASIPDLLRDRGYVIRTVPSPYRSTSLSTADEVLGGGHLNEFEVKLISGSPWTLFFRDEVATFLYEGQAEQVIDSIDETVAAAESRSSQPQFLLSHIHSPHPPFVLRPTSSPGRPITAGCFPSCSLWEARIDSLGVTFEDYRAGLARQIAALNEMLLDAASRIIAVDPTAVIILVSDHGTRYSLDDLPEHYRSFLAARTPGFDSLFPRDESPVNILRRVMAAYFDADVVPLPYRAWALDWAYNLRLTELPAN